MLSQISILAGAGTIPTGTILVLGAIFAVGLFIVGYDQGHLFSILQGADAFNDPLLHELYHDIRHTAGLPCH